MNRIFADPGHVESRLWVLIHNAVVHPLVSLVPDDRWRALHSATADLAYGAKKPEPETVEETIPYSNHVVLDHRWALVHDVLVHPIIGWTGLLGVRLKAVDRLHDLSADRAFGPANQ